MSNAVMPLSDYKDTCDKIREKTASTDNIKSGELADKVNEVYEKGRQAEYDMFWDVAQANGTRKEYMYAFSGRAWRDSIFKPKYNLNGSLYAYGMFYHCGVADLEECIKKSGIIFDTSNFTSIGSLFANAIVKVVPTITITNQVSLGSLFLNCYLLETIRKLIIKTDGTNTFSDTFYKCEQLRNIEFEGVIGQNIWFSQSTKLSKASILNIFSCLSDTATDKTLTLSKTAVNNAFETASGTADGSTSEEWLNLVASKPNWTISLST